MKNIFLALVILTATVTAVANEIIIINNQKVVLIETTTTVGLDKILQSELPTDQKVVRLKALFKKEANFCSTAATVYGDRNSTPDSVKAKCDRVLTSKHFIEELASDTPEYGSLDELQEIISKYLAILIAFK